MLSILGFIVVLGSVVLGYVLHHGNLAVLYQPTELLIIGGAAVGALLAASSKTLLFSIIHECIGIVKGSGISKQKYMELLQCMNELFRAYASNPLTVEKHVEKPEESEIFKKYPKV